MNVTFYGRVDGDPKTKCIVPSKTEAAIAGGQVALPPTTGSDVQAGIRKSLSDRRVMVSCEANCKENKV